MSYWFVGTRIDGVDQADRFISEGIWENGFSDRYIDKVKRIAVGDRIAIKATKNRKTNLPFDNHGNIVSCMSIKAVGVVTANPGDGRRVSVNWELLPEPIEWYFFTNMATFWEVKPGNWAADALIRFVFEGQAQDYGRYINHPFWFDRYGDISDNSVYRFGWARFYATVADNLLLYKNNRGELLKKLYKIGSRIDGFGHLTEKFPDGSSGPLVDICPFTVMGIFNRGISEKTRKAIASELKSLLEIGEPVPDCFDGIPRLNNMSSRFFYDSLQRGAGDIDDLWDVFYKGIRLADGGDDYDPSAFIAAYDKAAALQGVGWNLTIGLYWIRPWEFPTLDEQSREYITGTLGIPIPTSGPKGRCTAAEYLSVKDAIEQKFHSDDSPVHSFPALSTVAWGRESSSDVSKLVADRLSLFKSLVLKSFPGLTSVEDVSLHAEEIDYKRKASAEISSMLSASQFEEMMKAGEYSALIKVLRSAGGKTNLLYMGAPSKGDLAPLFNAYPDEEGLCSAFYSLMWGDGDSCSRLDSFYSFITRAALPVRWPTATYYLFMVHPSTEMFCKPEMIRWLLDFFEMPMKYESNPSGKLYGEILSLCSELHTQLSSWGVSDMIDVHSLIWAAHKAPGNDAAVALPEEEHEMNADSQSALFDATDDDEDAVPFVNPEISLEEIYSSTGYNRDWIGRAVAALRSKHQAVLYGPPGTGKTFLAEKIAAHIVGGGSGFVDVVQFHPSYSYEDFIEGLRPIALSGGGLEYRLVDGRFKQFCQRAGSVTGSCVLIVDEINRANLSRVFGELMYLLEYRDKKIFLAGGSAFSIPSNVFIIGTMNTADRSIALVDHALRRRFAFIHMKPDYSVLSHFHSSRFDVSGLVSVLERVNKAIEDRNYFVGVSFFLHMDIASRIPNVWQLEIEPYLEEFFFDRPEVSADFLWSVVGKEIIGRE